MDGINQSWQAFLQSLARLVGTALSWVALEIERHRPAPRPAPLHFLLRPRKDQDMAIGFDVTIRIPANPNHPQVASQKYTLNVDGGPDNVSDVPLADQPTDMPQGVFKDGQKLKGSLQYFNAAGQGGVPRVEEITLDSTVFPPQPTEFGFGVTEVEIPD